MESKCVFKRLSSFICKHKLIFLLALLVLAVAITVTAVMLSQSDDDGPAPTFIGERPDPNPITNGQDEKVYYYDLPEAEAILVLYKGWQFTLSGPSWLNKSGEYSIDKDGKLILDFVRNIDGVAYATVDERTAVMTYQGDTHTFYEKIAYTVSFNSNGGSKISSETVTNGKPLNSLTVPNKDGYVFEGWYVDEALTTPFNFGVTLITKDITLYAKWSEATQP